MPDYSSKEIADRVAQAARGGWENLDLMQCQVQVADLRKLLDEPGIEQLQSLDLDSNRLSTLPTEIGRLTALTWFDLRNNQLSTLPPEIGRLTALTRLWLSNNRLSTLPTEIGRLTALTSLWLNDNQLSTLPAEIGRLTALTELYLHNNQLSTLPAEIARLTALTTLWLNGNQLSTLPAEIGRLTALTALWLYNNQLSTLPAEIGRLTALERLFLHGNDALAIPPEILGPTWNEVGPGKKPAAPSAILDYYFRTRAAAGTRALNEVKVILVGQGAVGKTSLVKQIVHNTFNKRERKTKGIYIEKAWSVPGKKKGEKVQVNFWDFGGQEIMHATHQFFLTKRTVYLLVVDARKGENESNIHYWLKIIRSFGGESPVLVITNKCDAHHLELNETRLKKDYPNIRGFYRTSCETGDGIKELKAAIEKQIQGPAMRYVFDLLPKDYFTVKEKLETLAEQRNYIDIRDYYALCTQNGVTDNEEQDRLLRFLHDLGSVLSFTDPDSPLAVRETSVLNPHWVTQGVYKILNDEQLARAGGVLEADDLPRILKGKTHPVECHPFIVGMMHKFELCFTIKEDRKWLVTELLPKKEPPKLAEWEDALRFQYHYDVLPGGIICRFMVRRYEDLTRPPTYWRSGVVLEMDRCKALVRSDTDKGRMYIAVTGPEGGRRPLLSVIRDEFARIHRTIPGLLPKQMVPLWDNPDIVVSHEHLLTLEQERVEDFIPDGAGKRYTVKEMLDGIEFAWLREFGESHLYPPLFVVAPQKSFPDAWEVFCCEVLNRYYKTDKIRQRKPPENGVDLYCPKTKTAFQCKSVEKAAGKFNITNAEESLRRALEIRKTLPWKKYALCSNIALTEPQEKKLRATFPDIEFLTPSFWVARCREQSRYLGDRFRRLEPMQRRGPAKA